MILNPYVFAAGGGNWATWNLASASYTLTNGNRTASRTSGSGGAARSTSPFLDFTYAEFAYTPAADGIGPGLCNSTMNLSIAYLGQDANGAGYYLPSADVYRSAAIIYNGSTYSTTPVTVGIAVRGSVGTGWNVWIRRPNSTWEGGGDPTTNTSPTFTLPAGTYYPACTAGIGAGGAITINAGQAAFALWTPSGGFTGVPL